MKLGYNEGTCMKASTVELDLAECEKNGYDYIELRIELLQDYLMRNSLDDLKEFFDTHHLKPYSINSIENINFQTPETWSRLVEDFTFQCEVAEAIGIPYIVVCPTVGPVMASKKENEIIADTVEMLGELAEIAKPYGVRIAFEPIGDRHWSCSLRQAYEIVAAVDRNTVGLSLDFFNLYMHDKCADVGYIRKIPREKLFLVHITDCEDLPLGILDQCNRMMPGDGCMPIAEILDELKSIGYDGVVSVELFRPEYWEMEPAEVIQLAADKTRAFL